MPKQDNNIMVEISDKQIVHAISKVDQMDLKNKELVCDEIFIKQPNLLASVLVLQQMGNTLKEVDVLLNVLIVLYLALKESGANISKVSEQDQAHQLRLLTASVKFSEDMDSNSVVNSVNQYISSQQQKYLMAYVTGVMKEAGFYNKQHEASKYLIMSGLNLVSCIAHAIKKA